MTHTIDSTNVEAGTYYKIIEMANLKNTIFQYKLIAGLNNTVELQFWGTVYEDAEELTDDDWVNVTEFFTDLSQLSVTNNSVNDMSLLDTNCTFAKIKVKYIITTSAADNTIKVGWNSDR